jgi:AraC-like DNA-binding protein
MIIFEISHTDNKTLLKKMAAAASQTYNEGEDFFYINPPVGKGIIKVLNIADELQVLLADATFFQHILAKRVTSENRYYILHFDELFVKDSATFVVGDDSLEKSNIMHAVVRLTSNAFSNTEEISPHTPFKTLKIFFSENWLKNYLGLPADIDFLQKYMALKTASFDIEPLDADYLKLVDEFWAVRKDDPLQNIFLQNRVTLLIERFLTRLQQKTELVEGKYAFSSDVINNMMKVEKLLVDDFSKLPPTIEEFSKMISISSSKLKEDFKKIYGDSIYAYYQKQRLAKAHEILLTGKYTIKQTAAAIGYNNVSNFTLAYKKHYKKLPGQVLEVQ